MSELRVCTVLQEYDWMKGVGVTDDTDTLLIWEMISNEHHDTHNKEIFTQSVSLSHNNLMLSNSTLRLLSICWMYWLYLPVGEDNVEM